MITEDQLEQLAIQWFLDTDCYYLHCNVIAPENRAAEALADDWAGIRHLYSCRT